MIDIAFEQFHSKGIIDIKVVHEIVVVFHGVYPIANEKAYEEHTKKFALIDFFFLLPTEI
jgi:hypothetical protein